MEEIDFESDKFEDVLAKDARYDAHAYALLMDVIKYLGKEEHHFSSMDIMDEFKETALDQYGPLAYRVLTEWGLRSCEDIGEMMANLVEFHRVAKDETDSHGDFAGGYDFEETFLGPYQA